MSAEIFGYLATGAVAAFILGGAVIALRSGRR